jgi:hypothetical protein
MTLLTLLLENGKDVLVVSDGIRAASTTGATSHASVVIRTIRGGFSYLHPATRLNRRTRGPRYYQVTTNNFKLFGQNFVLTLETDLAGQLPNARVRRGSDLSEAGSR